MIRDATYVFEIGGVAAILDEMLDEAIGLFVMENWPPLCNRSGCIRQRHYQYMTCRWGHCCRQCYLTKGRTHSQVCEYENTCVLASFKRLREYPFGCDWEHCCKRCFATGGKQHDEYCESRYDNPSGNKEGQKGGQDDERFYRAEEQQIIDDVLAASKIGADVPGLKFFETTGSCKPAKRKQMHMMGGKEAETHAQLFPSAKASHARIDDLPPGISVGAVQDMLEQNGYRVTKLEKSKGSHLTDFEIQFFVESRKATFGISDFDGKQRVDDNVHGYVRASRTVLEKTVVKIKELLCAPRS